ncbi:hypothetical protein I203_105619 [Kwoniella mangroviensis CBS 8507]|uniref:uncharacterized protein n=1 Tax=Kwoniella mangroviensis CBS 8507 TaxID=1296122 RepID=UPI0030516DE7
MDDLVDLNWSDPSKPVSKTTTPQPTASSSSSFDFLSLSKPLSAGSGGNTPNYYSSTPIRSSTPSQPLNTRLNGTSNTNDKPISRSGTPLQNSTPQLGAGAGTGGSDAFSSLLSMPSSSSSADNKNMSMAERQKALEDEKKRKDEEDRKRFEAEGHFWDNLGSSSSSTIKPPAKTVVQQKDDFDDFLKPTPAPTSNARAKSPAQPTSSNDILSPTSSSGPSKSSSAAGTFWDNHHDSDDLLSGSASKPMQAQNSTSPAPPIDPFDFDALSASITQSSSQPQSNGNGHALGDDEFDILGDLGKPVSAKRPKIEPGPSRPSKPHSSSSRSSSPPPHIVGQIVEMGFSPIQARQALAKTSTGLDVQAALEILLGGQTPQSSSRSDDRDQDNFGEDDEDFVERERQRREEEERERRRRRRQGPSRDSVKARSAEEREQEKEASAQEQAEKYLAQASEIGTNMFNKATSFWNSSKEKAMKVYEEQRKVMEANAAAAGSGGEGRKPIKDGRPKWMTEAHDEEWNGQPSKEEKSGFRDDDHDENEGFQSRIRSKGNQPQSNGAGPSRNPVSAAAIPSSGPSSGYKSSKERADLLFADEAPRYKSPARHPKKPSTPAPAPVPAKPLPSRTLVSATSSQLEKSANYKAKGNEHFKLGRFAEAESSYTSAISQLPEGHLFLVPLHNNRAAARLKLGDSSPAVEDCSLVIELIGPNYHPSKEGPLPPDAAKEVKLFDGLVKALSKRAQAWEMGEKWKNALEDWEKLICMDLSILGAGASSTKNLAAEGARRSRKMLEGDGDGSAKPKSAGRISLTGVKPRPRPTTAMQGVATARPADVDKSAAVSELRAAAKALEAEDDQRLALKDSIEAKLNNWKNGKETNLRALIASLDLVLWDEIMKTSGMKVGMHELISEKQVKIKYMKVIARLHPDKLNSQNTTVEQRMLANGAFGTLNDAWQAFNK